MATEKTDINSIGITEENIFSKPKCQAILSIIAHFQQNKKNIQRAHLIRALVKNADQSSLQKDFETNIDKKMLKSEKHLYNNRTITKKQYVEDKNLLEKGVIDRLQALADITPKIMFNSIANLDKTVRHLRKLGLITNQYIRGYPRIILTDKGLILFYRYIIKRMVDELVHDGSQLMSISNHILTSFIPKEKKKTMVLALPELNFPEDH
jgi:hypothetical protein